MSQASSRGDATAEAPEEKLAFALSDGRVGVLLVSGRKVRLFPEFIEIKLF